MAKYDSTCSIDGCNRRHFSKGYCSTHHSNFYRYGHAIARRDWSVEATLDDIGWSYPESGCWEWRGDRNEHGYGRLTLARKGLFKARVHRLIFELYFGVIPPGMVIRHKCDNPPCSNPDHLELGTKAENSRDMVERGRHWRYGADECLNGHDISDPLRFRIAKRKGRGDEKVCLTCQRERHVRWYEKKKLERARLRESI